MILGPAVIQTTMVALSEPPYNPTGNAEIGPTVGQADECVCGQHVVRIERVETANDDFQRVVGAVQDCAATAKGGIRAGASKGFEQGRLIAIGIVEINVRWIANLDVTGQYKSPAVAANACSRWRRRRRRSRRYRGRASHRQSVVSMRPNRTRKRSSQSPPKLCRPVPTHRPRRTVWYSTHQPCAQGMEIAP